MLLVRLPPLGLSGRVRYSFLNERNERTFAHDARGRRVWGGHWNSNLITDAGLENAAAVRIVGDLVATQSWRTWLRVGTGSTEPAAANVALVSQVAATDSTGGFSAGSATYPDPSGGVITGLFPVTRVATLASAANLNEYGFSDTETGNLNIRELFRDETDDPITISIAAGKKIRVDHTLTVSIPWGATSQTLDIEEYDAADELVTTHEITVDALAVGAHRQNLFRAMQPFSAGGGVAGLHFTTKPSIDGATTVAPTAFVSASLDAYVPGSLERRNVGTFQEASGNGAVSGYTFGVNTAFGATGTDGTHGFRVSFTSPATFTKANTHTLAVAMIVSWARG